LWSAAVPELESIYGLGFIQQLQSGELTERDFAYYLAQDAIYLNGYSRVLARAGALAPTEEEQLFWAKASQQCLEVESELHRNWLSTREASTETGPVTKSYVDHLLATSASGSYAVVLAAILPCYWLYAEVGQQLHAAYVEAGAPADHAYADWLRTYADEDFAAATRKAIHLTDAAALAASEAERAAMMEAFTQSCRYETAFFDAPRLFA
jgi:hydroxymethylpyrimidine/phosphomethylpyrimidine kinase